MNSKDTGMNMEMRMISVTWHFAIQCINAYTTIVMLRGWVVIIRKAQLPYSVNVFILNLLPSLLMLRAVSQFLWKKKKN